MYGFIGQALVTIEKTVVTMGTNQLNLVTNEHGTPSTDVKLFRNYGCYRIIRIANDSISWLPIEDIDSVSWLPTDVIVVDALKQQHE